MAKLTSRVIACGSEKEKGAENEWLITNGLGGYASGTVSGGVSRRYHGLLVSALPAPLGRAVMLSRLQEKLCVNNKSISLNEQELFDVPASKSRLYLKEFRLEMGLPVWTYEIGQFVLEKRILLPHGRNLILINYQLLQAPSSLEIELRPAVHFRPLEAAVDQDVVNIAEYTMTSSDNIYRLQGGDYPPLLLQILGGKASFNIDNHRWDNIYFRLEYERGYPSVGKHWSPGFFKLELSQGQSITLMATTDAEGFPSSFETSLETEIKRRQSLIAVAAPHLHSSETAELILAADQFIITPAGRVEETRRALAAGEEAKTIIAGYHWFTDWGRDTMISLEGLTLATGRYAEARHILRTFANYVRDGLIPNMFPERDKTGLYHTADASLWFFQALHRYLTFTQDRDTLRHILPKLISIIDHHLSGTLFNIGVDTSDGLLKQGAEGYQLTWMDAKVGDWVVTPRRGKAVELNALWYNALCLMKKWLSEEGDKERAEIIGSYAKRTRESFNRRFWNETTGYLFDVVDGPGGLDDDACRPNQLLSIALTHPVLDEKYWQAVVNQVTEQLLTPVGLRSLSPQHADYKQNYDGDLFTRDAAYHQGTVWAWLIGPYIDAWVKVNPENRKQVGKVLSGFYQHMSEAGVGSISEIFDAEPPFTPRGCIAQAWSVAEVLRCLACYQAEK